MRKSKPTQGTLFEFNERYYIIYGIMEKPVDNSENKQTVIFLWDHSNNNGANFAMTKDLFDAAIAKTKFKAKIKLNYKDGGFTYSIPKSIKDKMPEVANPETVPTDSIKFKM